MTRYAAEAPMDHGQPAAHSATAVLLCNLGTPDAPTAPALRRYLGEFLSDPRVIEIPRAVWWLILHGIILRVRPARSAAKYRTVWMAGGSPLLVWTQRQADGLAAALSARGHAVTVRAAMRYGNPSVASSLDALKREGHERILVLPLYPQYSGPTTASLGDAVGRWSMRRRRVPEFRFVRNYHDDPGYIEALVQQIEAQWAVRPRPEKLLLSFHGVPKRTLLLGDPYHCECQKTGRLVAERLGLPAADVLVTFQSRFGNAEWLQPYTEPTLVALARAGIRRVDVMCPGFPADCLETLEEIAVEARAAFLAAGGSEFGYIPCLNDQPRWLAVLADIAERHLQGWPTTPPSDAGALLERKRRATLLGAER